MLSLHSRWIQAAEGGFPGRNRAPALKLFLSCRHSPFGRGPEVTFRTPEEPRRQGRKDAKERHSINAKVAKDREGRKGSDNEEPGEIEFFSLAAWRPWR